MKKFSLFVIGAMFAFLTSCGVNTTLMNNHTSTNTTVELSKKNFKIVKTVSGQDECTYVFMIGGFSSESIHGNAVAKMYQAANLTGSQAIINIVSEEHHTMVLPFFVKRTITVTGQVIEFTD